MKSLPRIRRITTTLRVNPFKPKQLERVSSDKTSRQVGVV
jgi:hypothetical protein